MDEDVADAVFRFIVDPLKEKKLTKANEKLSRLIEEIRAIRLRTSNALA